MQLFDGKVVWITGASSGIGEALVYAFVKRKAIVIASSNDLKALELVKLNCDSFSENVYCVPFDLSDTNNVSQIVKEQIKTLNHIDILINLGGVSQRAEIVETPIWLDRKIMEINYFGTIALTKEVLPFMIARKSGFVLATSSISGRFGFPLRSAYSASKQALHGFFETLYLENKKYNIKSSVIIPGRVRTNISVNALNPEGKAHGKLDDGQSGGLLPEEAAQIIIKGILKNKREILVGKSELIMLFVRRYIPFLFFRIADKIKST